MFKCLFSCNIFHLMKEKDNISIVVAPLGKHGKIDPRNLRFSFNEIKLPQIDFIGYGM
jgi:hypothetical protein